MLSISMFSTVKLDIILFFLGLLNFLGKDLISSTRINCSTWKTSKASLTEGKRGLHSLCNSRTVSRMFDSICMMMVVSSDGQSPSKCLIIKLQLARILEFEGNWTPSLETRRMSFEKSLDCDLCLIGNALFFNFVDLSVTIISLGEKCAEHNLGLLFPVAVSGG